MCNWSPGFRSCPWTELTLTPGRRCAGWATVGHVLTHGVTGPTREYVLFLPSPSVAAYFIWGKPTGARWPRCLIKLVPGPCSSSSNLSQCCSCRKLLNIYCLWSLRFVHKARSDILKWIGDSSLLWSLGCVGASCVFLCFSGRPPKQASCSYNVPRQQFNIITLTHTINS